MAMLPADSLAPSRPGASAWRALAGFLAFARHRPSVLFGLVVVVVTLFLAVAGPAVAPYDPERALPGMGLQPPSWAHPMGTDVSGMDILSRVIAAPRIDLAIALVSSLIAFVGGVLLGVISGYFAGSPGIGGIGRVGSGGVGSGTSRAVRLSTAVLPV